ncbi:phospholipase [Myxococcus sp. K15C18031901]|nr:phospholipase [Myxococcus dinghuensis]
MLTVNSGSGDGSYASGTQVTITADAPASGYVFDKWTGATVTSATSATTTLTMPAAATTVTATYKLASTGGVSITTENEVIGRLATTTGAPFPYAEYLPPGYLTSPTTTYPVVLHLHDSGESGSTSTEAQLVEVVSRYGPLNLIRTSATWKTYFGQQQAMVFAPRSTGGTWDAAQLDTLVSFLSTHYRVDPKRIYVAGRTIGGHGAWSYGYSFGDRVAALAAIGSNLGGPGPALTKLANVPVWMVDGWVTSSTWTGQHSWLRGLTKVYGWDQYLTFDNPAAALTYVFNATTKTWSTQAGAYATGTSPIRFTVYPQGADFATPTYENAAFWDWMFAQQRP